MKLSKSKEEKLYGALKNILSGTDIEGKIIYKDQESYCLFGKYSIIKTEDGYVASKNHYDTTQVFSQLKNAVTWVTLDNLNLIIEASRVCMLDKQICDAKIQMQVHQRMCKLAKDLDSYVLYKAKLQEDLNKKSVLTRELEGFVDMTKRWQYRAFKEASK